MEESWRPAVLPTEGGTRVLVFGYGTWESGVQLECAATETRPGVRILPDLSHDTASRVAEHVAAHRQPGDIVVASIHWGDNWGYEIQAEQQRFAHRLVDSGAVDLVHGHSSHHVKGIEVYREHLILYGCGDFIDDYEGIAGHEAFRPDLVLAYFPRIDVESGSSRLVLLDMVPFRSRRFRLERASREDAEWLQDRLNREGEPLGTGVQLTPDGVLELHWR